MCQPPFVEVEGFSTIGTELSITPRPLRAAPWEDDPCFGVPLSQHTGLSRGSPTQKGDLPCKPQETRSASPLLTPSGGSQLHHAIIQQWKHESSTSSSQHIVGQDSTASSSSSSSSPLAAPSSLHTWRSQSQRHVSFSPGRRQVEERHHSARYTEAGETDADHRLVCLEAGPHGAQESSDDEMLSVGALERQEEDVMQGGKQHHPGGTCKGEKAELHDLESRLELISLQRSLSAVKCEIFLDYLEHQQKKTRKPPACLPGKGGKASSSVDLPCLSGSHISSPTSSGHTRQRGMAGAGSMSFSHRGMKPPTLQVPGSSPRQWARTQCARSTACTPQGRSSGLCPEAAPFPTTPQSCRVKEGKASPRSLKSAEWCSPQLYLSASRTPMRKETALRWARDDMRRPFGSNVTLDSSSDSDDQVSSRKSTRGGQGVPRLGRTHRVPAKRNLALGGASSRGNVSNMEHRGSRQKNGLMWHLPKEPTRFSPAQHVPILPTH